MPPKSKRVRRSLEAAARGREVLKKARTDLETENSETGPTTIGSGSETPVETPPISMAGSSHVADPTKILEEFVEGWVQTLDPEEKKSLAMPLCLTLVNELSFTETRATELAAKTIYKFDGTVGQWHADLISNNGTFPGRAWVRGCIS